MNVKTAGTYPFGTRRRRHRAANWVALCTAALCLALSPSSRFRTPPRFKPRALSAFERNKAELLFRTKLPCVGCHRLEGSGGRIGPNLSSVGARLSPDSLYAMISDPQGTVPGTIMPRVSLDQATLELIASYLAGRVRSTDTLAPLPHSTHAQHGVPLPVDTPALYARFCAPCHGLRGRGDGPNAAFLPVRPTAHASHAYMSTRSDDALFDAISAGGYVMNRSNSMPPFGMTLTRDQIWALVRYLRSLCGCEGPGWSRDNR